MPFSGPGWPWIRRKPGRAGSRQTGWRAPGHEEFREELPPAVQDRLREEHPADLRVESAEQKAERIVTEELSRRGWTQAELGRRAKGDAEKAGIALRIRRERTVTLAWIAARLVMGSPGNVSNRLWHLRRAKPRRMAVMSFP